MSPVSIEKQQQPKTIVTQGLFRHSVREGDVLDKVLQRGKFSACIRKHQEVGKDNTQVYLGHGPMDRMGWHKDRQPTEGCLGLLKFLLSPEAHMRLSDKTGAQICG